VSDRVLVRGGCVLTLGRRTSNLPDGDVLIEDGRIAEVGSGLRARDAEVIDAGSAIVMPGFVDTHRHAWASLLRNAGDRAGLEMIDAHVQPDDLYAATLIGLLGAAAAGITTVVDWPDLPLDADGFEAVLSAHADAGVRTVLVAPGRHAATVRLLADRVRDDPGRTCAIGVSGEADDGGWALARDMGMRVHVHLTGAAGAGAVAEMGRRGTLDGDVTLVHLSGIDEADLDAIEAAGADVSLAPSSEMARGVGTPAIQQLMDRDVRPGLGVDQEGLSPGDLFAQIRSVISLQHATVFDRKLAGKAGLPKLMNTRDVIRFATSEGARVAGLAGATGSLEPGMWADLLVLRTDRPNVYPINDPIGAVVWGMDTSNIVHVLVGGRALVRDGVPQGDVARARALASEARDRVAVAAGIRLAGLGAA
jgi:5-methylthioadenosine/S-adenosylhomocysteine deaminase